MANREEEFLAVLNRIGSNEEVGPDTSDEGENPTSNETSGVETPESQSAPSEPIKNFSIKRAFSYRKTHPLILDMLLLDKYGPQWLGWEPETLWAEIEDDFKVSSISVHSRNKINALKLLHVMDTPWTEWEVFTIVCQALTNNIPDFRVLQKPSLDQIVSAIAIMSKIKKKDFSEEVGRYIAACALDDGIMYLPEPVTFAQEYLSEPKYKCKACGNIDSDTDNNMCDTCGAPQSSLELFYKRDWRPIKVRYDKVVSDGEKREYTLEENPVDVQVAKLLRAKLSSEQFDQRFSSQAEVLNG